VVVASASAAGARTRSPIVSLISAVGDAVLGPEHDMVVADLRQYKDDRGEEALNNHLKDVSAAFRVRFVGTAFWTVRSA
jgi:hypothetical protein